jgi:hypothetical protein
MRLATFLLLLFISSASPAQEHKFMRPAAEAEFAGYWRIILIPEGKSTPKLRNKDSGFADPCQFFVHRPDKTWINISLFSATGEEETRRLCPAILKKDVDAAITANAAGIARYKWRNLRGALYAVDGTSSKDQRIWAADYVTEDASIPDYFDFRKGDLLMSLTEPGPNGPALLWRMVLRPVPDQPAAAPGPAVKP